MQLPEVQAIFPGTKSSHMLWTSSQEMREQAARPVTFGHCDQISLWALIVHLRVPREGSTSSLCLNTGRKPSLVHEGISKWQFPQVAAGSWGPLKASFGYTSSQSEWHAKPWQTPIRKGCKPAVCWRKATFMKVEVKHKQQAIQHMLRLWCYSGFAPIWNGMCCGVFSQWCCSPGAQADPICCCHQLLASVKQRENFTILYSHSTKAAWGLTELVMKPCVSWEK